MIPDWPTSLVDLAVRATLALGLAGLVALAMRRRSAAARHLAWSAALCACLALPLAAPLAPSVDVPVGPRFAAVAGAGDPAGAANLTGAINSAGDGANAPIPPVRTRAEAAALPADRATPGWSVTDVSWTTIWFLGAGGMLLLLLGRLVALRRVERAATPAADASLLAALAAARARLDVARPVRLLTGVPGSMPMTWGHRRPRVLLPPDAGDWPAEQVEAVLLHELAHVRRGDVAMQRLAETARALLWFHPLAWYATWRLLVEREHACDDVVIRSGIRRSDYAHQLLGMAHALRGAGAAAGLPMARRSQMTGRLLAIMDESRPRRGLRGGAVPAGLALGAALALLVAMPTPTPAGTTMQELANTADAVAPPTDAADPATDAIDPLADAVTYLPCWRGKDSNSNKNHDPGLITAEVRTTRCFVFLRISGYAILRPDSAGFAWIEPGGRVTISERQGALSRSFELVGGDDGKVIRSGLENGTRMTPARVEDWLAGNLAPLVQRTGVELEVGPAP